MRGVELRLFVGMASSRDVCSYCSLSLSRVGFLVRGGLGDFMGSATCVAVTMSPKLTPMTWVACLGTSVWWPAVYMVGDCCLVDFGSSDRCRMSLTVVLLRGCEL